ncbi:MAG: geranylgeranyl reductase family protein [Desulfobulbaceae bacterium]
MDRYDAAIIGAGPGGLACATALAAGGARVIVLERRKTIGRKVCAGGLTWHGFIRRVPEDLIQRTFPEQHIFSRHQRIRFRKPHPIIATVNREELGKWMAKKAAAAGARIETGWLVTGLERDSLKAVRNKSVRTVHFDHLVGADGSSSVVRRFLNLPVRRVGFGINVQVPETCPRMEWHLDPPLFGSGYAWIFPHRETTSVGVYSIRGGFPPSLLRKNFVHWAAARGFALNGLPARAELINHDFRGLRFNRTWLVGDAAGTASGLTGEGINPAIVSGEEVAAAIIDPAHRFERMKTLLKKHRRHVRMVELAARNSFLCTFLLESLVLLLRFRLVDFQEQLSL